MGFLGGLGVCGSLGGLVGVGLAVRGV